MLLLHLYPCRDTLERIGHATIDTAGVLPEEDECY